MSKTQVAVAALGAAGEAAKGMGRAAENFSKPATVVKDFHEIDGDGGYRDNLVRVSDTAKTADNVMTVFSDPKKLIGIILVLAVLFLILRFFWKKIKAVASEAMTPVTETAAVLAIESEHGDTSMSAEAAGTFADSLYSLFGYLNDDNDGIVAKMKSLKKKADYYLVKMKFGERKCKKIGSNHTHDLPGMLRHNLNNTRCQAIQEHLSSLGVENIGIS